MRVRATVWAAVLALACLLAPGASAATVGAISEFGIPSAEGEPYGIAPGPDGNLWFTEAKKGQIGRITTGGEVTEFPLPSPAGAPTGITTGPDGNVWFLENEKNKVGRITPTGAISEFEIPTGSSKPLRITAGPDGNLWFVEEKANKIARITPSGAFAEFSVPTEGSAPSGIAWGPDGNLWFTENNANKIGRISPTGTFAEFPMPTANTKPEAIVPGPDGNLWFAEGNKRNIGRITPSGVVTEFPVPGAKGVVKFEWITSAPDGNLWFTEPEANNVGRITPSGAISEFPLPTPESLPGGIAPGADGNLWFTESASGRIGRIGAGAAEALASAPVVNGGAQQGSAQTCGTAWSTWASLQPLPNFFGFDGYRWLLDGAPIASGQAYTPTIANIGHKLACSATVTYPPPLFVTAVATSAPVVVVAPPTPTITGPTQSARTWREGRALAQISRRHHRRRPPVGTTFSFTLNVQASVSFTFMLSREGRRVGRKCVARTRRNARRRSCALAVTVGRLSFAGHAGANKVVFDGLISSSSRLARGRYTLVIVATNTAGVPSAPASLRFAIVR